MSLRNWVRNTMRSHRDVVRIGYFGSIATGNWGVGSDLDLLVIVRDCKEPFERRGRAFDALGFPVPVDLLVYTEDEWQRITKEGKALKSVVWLGNDPIE